MTEPPIWGGSPEPGGAPDHDPGRTDPSPARGGGHGRPAGGRHAAHRAPRKGLREQLQRRYVVLGAAVLGLVVVATLLFGACSDDSVSTSGEPQVTAPTGTPSVSESVVSRPTISATTTTPSPTATSGSGKDGDAKATGKATGKATDKATGKATKKATSTAAAKAPVLVLNNSRITGLAARWATRIRAGGWTVTDTDNWTRTDLAEPTVFYARGHKAAAEAFAKKFDVVADVRPALSGMGPALTLVLTRSAA